MEAALTEEARERTAVGDLREQLQLLRHQVQEAQERLQLTQARVDQNLNRVNELKVEAVSRFPWHWSGHLPGYLGSQHSMTLRL